MSEDSLITYEDLPLRGEYKEALSEKGIKIQRELKWFNAVSAYLSQSQLESVKSFAFVSKVERVRIFRQQGEPEAGSNKSERPSKTALIDTLNYGYSFTQLEISDIPFVHSLGIDGKDVIIGILDSGFDWKNHKALKNQKVIKEFDFVFNDTVTANQAADDLAQDSHGTYVFSIVGGYDPGSFVGAAFNASYLLAKTEDIRTGNNDKHIEEDNYASALEWMESYGVDITSSSLSYNTFIYPEASYSYSDMNGQTAIVTKAAELAYRRGVVVITAAGNEGNKEWHYITAPADGANVIAVGAVTSNNNIAAFSSRGPTSDGRIKPDVDAMGVSVFGANAHSKVDYNSNNGTSAATPIVSGTAALLLSAYPYLRNYQVRGILLETSDNSSSPDFDRGYGLVSAKRAIEFPNLEFNGGQYVVHKAFPGNPGIKQNTLKLFYSADNEGYSSIAMTKDKDGFYSAAIPEFEQGKIVKFYFEYENSNGAILRDSQDKNYRFLYGYLTIARNINSLSAASYPEDFVLSQNYPNPFNSSTRIDFKAKAGEKAELFIINAIGQRIRYFDRTTEDGINSVIWNGRTEDGTMCASGVYYYILKLSGNDYGKKMILLK